jgi:hypothetical protein
MSPDPDRRAHRAVRLGAWVMVALLALPFIGWRFGLSRKIDSRLKTAKASGYPVNALELDAWYRPVSPDANMAFVYDRAFARFVPPANRGVTADYLKLKLPARKEAMSGDLRAEIAGVLANNQEALELLHQAATRPQSRYPINLTLGPNTLLPHLTPLKHASRLLEFEAIDALENGNAEKAVRSVQASLGLGRSLATEPLLISQLVRISLDAVSCRSLERVLNRARLSDLQLQALNSALLKAENPDALARALIGEQSIGFTLFTTSYRDALAVGPAGRSSRLETVAVDLLSPLIKATGFFQRDQVFYFDTMQLYLETLSLPSPRNLESAKRAERRIDEAKRGYYIFSAMLLPAFSKTVQKNLEWAALLRVSQTALAIERFRLGHEDRVPDSLSALVPAYLPSVPVDPFDGQPLRYARRVEGYVVYSIGPDGVDDGGGERKEKAKFRGPQEPHDILFVVER